MRRIVRGRKTTCSLRVSSILSSIPEIILETTHTQTTSTDVVLCLESSAALHLRWPHRQTELLLLLLWRIEEITRILLLLLLLIRLLEVLLLTQLLLKWHLMHHVTGLLLERHLHMAAAHKGCLFGVEFLLALHDLLLEGL